MTDDAPAAPDNGALHYRAYLGLQNLIGARREALAAVAPS